MANVLLGYHHFLVYCFEEILSDLLVVFLCYLITAGIQGSVVTVLIQQTVSSHHCERFEGFVGTASAC